MEMSEEETLKTQRFDLVVVWKGEERFSPEELRNMLAKSAQAKDPEATVDVDEVPQPAH